MRGIRSFHRHLLVAALVAISLADSAMAFECPALVRSGETAESAGYDSGLLWRVRAADGAINHIFGTIHLSDPRVTALHTPVRDALHASKRFAMEVLLDAEALQRMSQSMYYGDGQSLKEALDAEVFERTVELLLRYGVTAQAARNLKPWAAYTTLSLPPAQSGMPLDLALLEEARANGKAVAGLETIDEQIAVFDGLTTAEQAELLVMTVCHYGLLQGEVEEMIRHYLARDLTAMMQISIRYASPLQDRFLDILLHQRNHRMVARMQKTLAEGDAFIAIGALHLPGSQGILNLLRNQGYELERIY